MNFFLSGMNQNRKKKSPLSYRYSYKYDKKNSRSANVQEMHEKFNIIQATELFE
jgi:hypothetical protein